MPIKISDLTIIAAALAAGDLVVTVDVSDTTQAASGSTRKVPMSAFLQAFAQVGVAMADPLDTDVLPYYDGATPAVPKTITPAELRHILAQTGVLPTTSAAQRLRYGVRAKGRPLLSARHVSGREYVYQPAPFSVSRAFIGPSTGTALLTEGLAVTSVGTISHPAPTQVVGRMSNHVTGGAAGNTAGTGDAIAAFFRGTGAGPNEGYYFNGRIYVPDASYDETGAATGSRIFAGLTSVAMSAVVASDNPAGDHAGFARNSVNAGLIHSNWQVMTKDAATITFTDTGVAFAAQQTYDLMLWQPGAGGTLYWAIDNLSTGTTSSGSVATTLPTPTTALRFGMQVQSVNAVARNIRQQHLYCESDA